MATLLSLRLPLLCAVSFFFVQLHAQPPASNFSQSKKLADGRFSFLRFDNTKQLRKSERDTSVVNIKSILGLGLRHSLMPDIRFLKDGSARRESKGTAIRRYSQYFKGVKVEYGTVTVQSASGSLTTISGEYFPVADNFSTAPLLSSNAALSKAIAFVGAKKYSWEDSTFKHQYLKGRPKGELVICKDFTERSSSSLPLMKLAYKFAIYATEPLRYDDIYVDAGNGNVIHTNPIIKHVSGTAATRYSGSKTISTSQNSSGNYILRDSNSNYDIATYDMKRGTNYTAATNFTDNDNNWSSAEHNNSNYDNAALDAHWGTMMTADYWRTVHNRNGFDNNGTKLRTYVHYGTGYVNAFWNGYEMTYGDGDGSSHFPLTSLDIVGHEIGHAVCQHTSNLIYSGESGALNEGFSDIWGACIKRFAAPEKNTWLNGDEISSSGTPFRSMSNPKSTGSPDTYKGVNWFTGSGDNGGVHFNSGVLNHWFYILTEGKTGTNDNGTSYNVSGIGITKAAKIAFRAESIYLFPSAAYIDARIFMIQSAQDLYGANSDEVIQTAAAWDAVGVYDVLTKPGNLAGTLNPANNIALSWYYNTIQSIDGFVIERSTNESQDYVQIATVTGTIRSFIDTSYSLNSINKYRIRSYKGTVYSDYSNIALVSNGNATYVMQEGNISACGITFLDPGGSGNYNSMSTVTTTISPTLPGNKLRVAFTQFRTESYSDYLLVYNGPNTSSPYLGYYTGTTLPPVLESTAPNGELTFVFYSNTYGVDSGWSASVSCFLPVTAPSNLTASVDSAKRVHLKWTDHANDETKYVVERSVNNAQHFQALINLLSNTTAYTDSSAPDNSFVYYRVRAYRDTSVSKYTNQSSVVIGNAPFIMENTSVSSCSLTFLDPGGTANYRDSSYITTTFSPAIAGNKIRVAFSQFRTESSDYLYIYDGPNAGSPFLGAYSGATLPQVLQSSALNGELTFVFYSSASGVDSGWRATVSCFLPVPSPTNLTATADSTKRVKLRWTDNAADETKYVIERSTNDALHFQGLINLAANATTYTDSSAPDNSFVYYRVKAYRDTIASIYSNSASARIGDAPHIMQNGLFTTCGNTFLDPGGFDNYSNSAYVTTTIAPAITGNKIRVAFTSFRTELYGDYLYVYNGPTTNSPFLGAFSGTTIPPVLESSASNGELTFIFSSNSYWVDSGWQAYISCFKPVAAPSNLTATVDTLKRVHLKWTDNATDETKYVVERSVNDSASYFPLKNLTSNSTSYVDSSAPDNSLVYYRVRAFRDTTASRYSASAGTKIGNAPYAMQNGNVSTCGVTFLDPGGFGNYGSYNNIVTTIYPAITGNKIRVAFTSFRTQGYYDQLYIYNGPNTSAPLIGAYSGSTLPPVLESTATNGALTFHFYSSSYNGDSGWQAYLSCFKPLNAPTNLSAAIDSSKRVNLHWSDNAVDESKYVVERSLNDTLHFLPLRTLPSGATSFIDSTAPDKTVVYYRVNARRDTVASKYSNTIRAIVGDAVVIMQNGSFNTCGITFLDPGGFDSYGSYSSFTSTFTPADTGRKLRADFSEFELNSNSDYIKIFDGPTTSSPLLGTFTGNTIPPVLESSAAHGELTFEFYAGWSTPGAGWQAFLSCFKPVPAPTNLTGSANNSKKVSLKWTDNANDETGYVVERSLNSSSKFVVLASLPFNTTSYTDSSIPNNNLAYYRVKGYRDTVRSFYSNILEVIVGNPPFFMKDSTIITCSKVFMDPGGQDVTTGYSSSTATIKPSTIGNRIRVSFSKFNISGYLQVYNGSSPYGTHLGTFQGSSLPPLLEGTEPDGALTFVYHNYGYPDSGWVAQVDCYKPVSKPSGLRAVTNSASKAVVEWQDNADDETKYVVERSINTPSQFKFLAELPANSASFIDSVPPNNSLLFYRVQALRDTARSYYSDIANTAIGNAPFLMRDSTLITCDKVFMDPGGTDVYYPYYNNIQTTFKPSIPGNRIKVTFSRFSIGSSSLYVFNGSRSSFNEGEIIGVYSGFDIPRVFEGTGPEGALTFMFSSGYYNGDSGWVATVSCYKPVNKPTGLTAITDTAKRVRLTWVDNGTDETKYVVERSVNSPSQYMPVTNLPANSKSFTDSAAPDNSRLYYRVRAYRDSVGSFYSDTAETNVGNAPFIMKDSIVVTCSKIFMDPGGTDVYPYKYSVATIKPAIVGNRVRVTFSKFSINSSYLSVYNGSSVYDPFITNYSGSGLPPVLEGTGPDGSLTFAFSGHYSDSGWVALITCYKPVARPTTVIAKADSAQNVTLKWLDNSSDETKFVVERSVNLLSGFAVLAHLPANTTSYIDSNPVNNSFLFYRVKAFRDLQGSYYSDTAKISIGNPPFLMTDSTVVTCNTVFMDAGGEDVTPLYSSATATFKPLATGSRIRVAFSALEINGNLYVYNGTSNQSPFLGGFNKYYPPPVLEGTGPDGALTFVYYNGGYVDSGWLAKVTCFKLIAAPSKLAAIVDSTKKVALSWSDNSTDETKYLLERSVDDTLHFSTLKLLPSNSTKYIDSTAPDNSSIYYRVVAFGDAVESPYSNIANVLVGDAPMSMTNGNFVTCSRTFFDPGGTGPYGNSGSYVTTFTPGTKGNKIKVLFSEFDTEGCCDYLRIYNGPTTASPLLGSYAGSTIPPGLVSTALNGELTFSFYSDGSVNRSGWKSKISCVTNLLMAPALVSTAVDAKTVFLQWEDSNSSKSGFIIERSQGDSTHFKPVAYPGANSTSFSDNSAFNNIALYYRIKAVNGNASSGYSNIVSARTLICNNAVALAVRSASVNVFFKPNTVITDDSCKLFAHVQPQGTSAVSGGAKAAVRIDNSVTNAFGLTLAQRHFDILPDSNYLNATGLVKMYFTQAEFDNYNLTTRHAKLPVNAADANGISNIRVFTFRGPGNDSTGGMPSYNALPAEVEPANVETFWNTSYNAWEVRANLKGFGGLFLSSKDDTTFLCSPMQDTVYTALKSNIYGNSYQWQKYNGTNFVDINDTGNGTGTNTYLLEIKNSSLSGIEKFRCFVDGSYSRNFIVIKGNRWTGVVSADWNNAKNWSCGEVPGPQADIIVEGGKTHYPKIMQNTTCGSLNILQGGTVQVASGVILTVLH